MARKLTPIVPNSERDDNRPRGKREVENESERREEKNRKLVNRSGVNR